MKKGFTLVELLVTISIIGILSTLMIANFNSTRQRARDAQRKSDLKNIQTALRLYYNDCGEYPTSNGGVMNGCGSCTALAACTWDGESPFETSTQTYMNKLPQDPQYDGVDVTYSYTYVNDDDYTLSACLENRSDDACIPGSPCNDGNGCLYSVRP